MGIQRFKDHPIINEFNGLKKFFRAHETDASRKRISDFKNFVDMVRSTGDEVAFDIMGSVNFGQAVENSDTDIVIYLNCDSGNHGDCDHENCSRLPIYKHLLVNSIVYENSGNNYQIQVVDCINLNQLDYDLETRNFDSMALLKFGFYRSICRGVNRKLLHSYEQRLESDEELCKKIEAYIADCFLGLIHSNSHTYSFKKYMERVQFSGFQIPPSMLEKINSYLSK
ncbi:MAG: hypothetical protein KDK36_02670 [Leptospiraceae bacterium]|nr:hypothetical protein [Leptospiraceae bacterium]